MSDILSDLLSHIDPATVGQIAGQLGVDEGTAQQGIQAALPLLLGGLARNAQTPDGADALSTALTTGGHDGSILNDLLGAVMGSGQGGGAGAAILGHIFGGQQSAVAGAVGQQMGGANGAQLLQLLAPIVMGYLGQRQQTQGLDASGLAGLLLGHQQSVAQSGGAMGLISQLLDGNHDGSPLDDILGMAGKFLRR